MRGWNLSNFFFGFLVNTSEQTPEFSYSFLLIQLGSDSETENTITGVDFIFGSYMIKISEINTAL